MPEVIVIARGRAQAGRESEMQAALQACAVASRKEAGCGGYTLLLAQNDPTLFMTYERWGSMDDFNEHMATPHVQALFAALGGLVAEPPEIQILSEV